MAGESSLGGVCSRDQEQCALSHDCHEPCGYLKYLKLNKIKINPRMHSSLNGQLGAGGKARR